MRELGHMLPTLTGDERPDRVLGDAVGARQFRLGNPTRRPLLSDFTDKVIVEASGMAASPSHLTTGLPLLLGPSILPAFGDHVLNVVGWGADPEMPDAGRVIAPMEHPHAIGHFAMFQSPGEDVGIDVTISGDESAIPLSTTSPCPYPAWSKVGAVRLGWPILVDTGPESLRKVSGATALHRTEPPFTSRNSRCLQREGRTTGFTHQINTIAPHLIPPSASDPLIVHHGRYV